MHQDAKTLFDKLNKQQMSFDVFYYEFTSWYSKLGKAVQVENKPLLKMVEQMKRKRDRQLSPQMKALVTVASVWVLLTVILMMLT